MSIVKIYPRDIFDPRNRLDIVVGMNTTFAEASSLSLSVLEKRTLTQELELGDVITFDFNNRSMQKLHLIICSRIGSGGWKNADQYVRWGLDYLWRRSNFTQEFSIVQIGTGQVGQRDGADAAAIHTAMALSFVPTHLYVLDEVVASVATNVIAMPSRPIRIWNMHRGEKKIPMVA